MNKVELLLDRLRLIGRLVRPGAGLTVAYWYADAEVTREITIKCLHYTTSITWPGLGHPVDHYAGRVALVKAVVEELEQLLDADEPVVTERAFRKITIREHSK